MNFTTLHATSLAACALATSAIASGCGGSEIDATRATGVDTSQVALSGRSPAVEMPGPAQFAAGLDATGLPAQIAQLRQEVAELRRQVVRLSAEPLPHAPTASDPRSDAQAREQAERSEQSRMAEAESAFRLEPVDASWSRETATRLGSALAADNTHSAHQARSIECRSQTCRVELAPVGEGAPAVGLPRLLMLLSPTLPRASVGRIELDGGQKATVLYLSH